MKGFSPGELCSRILLTAPKAEDEEDDPPCSSSSLPWFSNESRSRSRSPLQEREPPSRSPTPLPKRMPRSAKPPPPPAQQATKRPCSAPPMPGQRRRLPEGPQASQSPKGTPAEPRNHINGHSSQYGAPPPLPMPIRAKGAPQTKHRYHEDDDDDDMHDDFSHHNGVVTESPAQQLPAPPTAKARPQPVLRSSSSNAGSGPPPPRRLPLPRLPLPDGPQIAMLLQRNKALGARLLGYQKNGALTAAVAARRAQEETRAMEVLARHVARLGPAGGGLETAVKQMSKRLRQVEPMWDGEQVTAPERWAFFERPGGEAEYKEYKERFAAVYDADGRIPKTDRQVMEMFTSTPASASTEPTESRDNGWEDPRQCGGLLRIATRQVRFAHNDQSERFGRLEDERRPSLLQLVVELLAGVTQPDEVPCFTVCWHDGLCYCRSGNRRLAAFRLASTFDPNRFGHVNVRQVMVDDVFLYGKSHGPGNRNPKLTTSRNGPMCKGRWLLVRETGEVIGESDKGEVQYGKDLLDLLWTDSLMEAFDA